MLYHGFLNSILHTLCCYILIKFSVGLQQKAEKKNIMFYDLRMNARFTRICQIQYLQFQVIIGKSTVF